MFDTNAAADARIESMVERGERDYAVALLGDEAPDWRARELAVAVGFTSAAFERLDAAERAMGSALSALHDAAGTRYAILTGLPTPPRAEINKLRRALRDAQTEYNEAKRAWRISRDNEYGLRSNAPTLTGGPATRPNG